MLCVPFRETVVHIQNMQTISAETLGPMIHSCVFLAPVVSVAPLGVIRRLHVPDTSTCGDQTYNIYYALMCALNLEQYLVQRHVTDTAMREVLLACTQPLQPLFDYYKRFYENFNCIAPDDVCLGEADPCTVPVLSRDVSGVAVIRPHLGRTLKPHVFHFKNRLPAVDIQRLVSENAIVFPGCHVHRFIILNEDFEVTINWLRGLSDPELRKLHPIMIRAPAHVIAPPLDSLRQYLVMAAVCLRVVLATDVMHTLGNEVSSNDVLSKACQLGPEERTHRKTKLTAQQFHAKVLADIPTGSLLEVLETNRIGFLNCRLFILTHLPLLLHSIKDDRTLCTDAELAAPVLPNHCLSRLAFWFPYPDRVYHVHDQPSNSLGVMQTAVFSHDPRNRSGGKDVDSLCDFFALLDHAPDRPLSMAHVTQIKRMMRMDVTMHRFVCDGLWAGLLGLYPTNTVILGTHTYIWAMLYVRRVISMSLSDLGQWIKQHFRVFELCMYMKYIHTVESLPAKQTILRSRYIHFDQWVQNCTDATNIMLLLMVGGEATLQANRRFLAEHIRFDYMGRRMTSKVKFDCIGNINVYTGNFNLVNEQAYMTVLTFTEALMEILDSEPLRSHQPRPVAEQDPEHIRAMRDLARLMAYPGDSRTFRDPTLLVGFGMAQETASCVNRYICRLCSSAVVGGDMHVATMPECTANELDIIQFWARSMLWRASIVPMNTDGTGFRNQQIQALRHLVHVNDYQYMHNLTNILAFAKKREILSPLYASHYGYNTMSFDIICNDFVPTKSDPDRGSTRQHLLHRVEQINALGAVVWFRKFERPSMGRAKADIGTAVTPLTRGPLENREHALYANKQRNFNDRVTVSSIDALLDRDKLNGIVLADCCGVYTSTTNASGPWANSTFWCGRCTTHANWEHYAFACDMCNLVLKTGARREFISCQVFDVLTGTMEVRIYCTNACCNTYLIQHTLLNNSGLVVESMAHHAINQAEDLADIGMGLPNAFSGTVE